LRLRLSQFFADRDSLLETLRPGERPALLLLVECLKTVIKWPKGSFLHIADHEGTHPKRKVFDPFKHSFNLFDDLDYRKACDIVSAVMALFPDKENTLTKKAYRSCCSMRFWISQRA
jgi:hypothetical protein